MFSKVIFVGASALVVSLAPRVSARPSEANAPSSSASVRDSQAAKVAPRVVGDAESNKEEEVSLAGILRHAHDHAPSLSIARASIAQGRALVTAESHWFPSDPVLSASVARRGTVTGVGVDYGVALEQEIDVSGRRHASLNAARAELGVTKAAVAEAEWQVHQQIHAAFHRALIARERLLAAQRVLAFADRLVVVASQRHAAGETSPLPVRLAEAELSQAKQAAILSESQYDEVRLELARVAGWSSPTLPTPTGRLEPPATPPALADLVAQARQHQPILRSAKAREGAAAARLDAAESQAWPNVTVGARFENEANPGSEPNRILGATLSVPLPFWVSNTPATAISSAEVLHRRAEERALSDSLELSVVQAHQRVTGHARRAAVFGAEILPTLETNLELLRKAFELGEIDVLQVMVAQERFLRTQQDALHAFEDYYSAWAELEAIVGSEIAGADADASSNGRQQ